MCDTKHLRIRFVIMLSSWISIAGCAQIGLVQQNSPATDFVSGSVRILGPVLHPQRLIIPADGLPFDQVVDVAQRPGSTLGAIGSVEMVYRQRGATRLFIPVMLIRQTALGSILIRDRDVVGCLKLSETPVFNVEQKSEASVAVRGLVTVSRLTNAEGASPGFDADGDITLKLDTGGANLTIQKLDNAMGVTEAQNTPGVTAFNVANVIGVTPGVNHEDGYLIYPDIMVLSRIGEDGYIEQYVFPKVFGNSEVTAFESIALAAYSRTPLSDGDVLDFTLIELLPEAMSGTIRSTLLDEQDLTETVAANSTRGKCRIQPGPTLRPITSLIKNSASQTSSIFRSVSAPTVNMFRSNSGL